MQAQPITEQDMDIVIGWIDTIPLSRPKKNINRDFADGVLMAEIMQGEFPRLVEVHNYPAANSASQKYSNWNLLNKKVFKRLGFQVNKTDIEHIITGTPDVILKVLRMIQLKILAFKKKHQEIQHQSVTKEYIKQENVDKDLFDKDTAIKELRQTIDILDLKLKKMDQLNKLKDAKIQTLNSKLHQAGLQ